MKTLKQIREASGGKEAYQKFFNSLLKKFGVDSPSELEGKKKKDFFDAIDKGWEGSGEKDEATILEKVKAKPGKFSGRGKDYFEIDIVVPDKFENDDGEYPDYYKAVLKKYKVKLEYIGGGSTEYMHKASGKKSDILAWGLGKPPIGFGVTEDELADYFDIDQELYTENKDDFKSDEDESDDKGNYSGVDEASRYSRDLRGPAKQIFLKTLEKIRKEKIRGDKDQAAAVDTIDGAQHLNGRDKRTIIMALQYESHDDFKDDSDVDDDEGNYSGVDEKAPPGMEDVVKKLKQDHSDEEAFAIAWSIHNKKEGFFGKSYPVMDQGQRTKIIKIAKKHSGNMQKAIKLIDKIRKGLSDNPAVMDILKKANEDVKEGVDVDRRTLGFKAAMIRREVAKKVREKSKLKKEKKKEQEVLDARYDYDGGVDIVLAAANKKIFGETAANSVASGNVDMAPNAGKKKKKKEGPLTRYGH